jgi:hypothetical protein
MGWVWLMFVSAFQELLSIWKVIALFEIVPSHHRHSREGGNPYDSADFGFPPSRE